VASHRYELQIYKSCYFGDSITCSITITKIEKNGRAEAEAFFSNQDDKQVCYAYMTGRLPLNQEQELLEKMNNEDDPTNKLSNENYRSFF
jgi:hypothetical protein